MTVKHLLKYPCEKVGNNLYVKSDELNHIIVKNDLTLYSDKAIAVCYDLNNLKCLVVNQFSLSLARTFNKISKSYTKGI